MKEIKQLKLKQLRVIIIAWMVMGLLITLHDHFFLYTSNVLGPSKEYSFWVSLARNVGAGLIGGLLGGSILVFYIHGKYQNKPYAYTMLIVGVSFILIVAFITVLMGLIIVPLRTGKSLSDPLSQTAFIRFLRDSSHIKAAIVWFFVVLVTQLLLQVGSKFGYADFWNIVRGRYNTPQEEKKIFMFLDLNSSTTIAEKLGDEVYHAFLKDFFADISSPILQNKGTVYQYVGDEVVVAWSYEDGIRNRQCIKCFFDIKAHIQKQKEKYMLDYGLVPTFKAAFHCGRVIAGEVGIIKRDVTYSGDVLNTTSRILSKCSEFKEEVIASSDLLSELCATSDYISRPLGAIKFRGKEKEIWLSALLQAC